MSEKSDTETPNAADDKLDAKTELESLLSEFDASTADVAPATTPKTLSAEERLAALESATNAEAANRNAEALVARIKKENKASLGNVSDDVIRDLLDGQVARNPAIAQAFMQRNQHPRKWNEVVKKLGNTFAERLNIQPTNSDTSDTRINSDRKAVADALNGASLSTSSGGKTGRDAENARIKSMSASEFRNWEREHGITI